MTLVLRAPSPLMVQSNSMAASAEKMAQAMDRIPSAISALSFRRQPATSIIGPEAAIAGYLDSRGDIEILGQVRGEVSGRRIVILPGALVEGAIIADLIEVQGTVNGPLTALEITIGSGARVFGKITHHKLTVEPGALTQGLQPWQPAQFFTG